MLDRRSTEAELLDDPNLDGRIALESYRFMAIVNRHAGGTRVVRRFVEREALTRGDGRLHVLDIGSGVCDIPIAVAKWARGRGLQVRFTCIEPSVHAARYARERIAGAGISGVRLLQEGIFEHRPDEPYDCAAASMCLHHFDDEAILAMFRKIRPFVRASALINDLRRTPAAWLATNMATLCVPRAVRHDAMLSVRRGFRIGELKRLLGRLEDCAVPVEPARFFRIAAVVRFAETTRLSAPSEHGGRSLLPVLVRRRNQTVHPGSESSRAPDSPVRSKRATAPHAGLFVLLCS